MKKTTLIAESGSTKTDWRLCFDDGTIKSFSSIGLNPYFVSDSDLTEILTELFSNDISSKIDAVFFYGAGCSNSKVIISFQLIFSQHFENAKIEINHDLLAASRALFQNQKGMALIFGTGSNSCLFDGVTITSNIPALGYILGDEGSGADMGKRLVTRFIHGQLNLKLTEKLKEITSKEDIFQKVYKEKYPNRYLANFSRFIADNIHEEQIEGLVLESFHAFFENYVIQYQNYENYNIGVVGSLGNIYKKQLVQVSKFYDLDVFIFLYSPITELVKYHTKIN